MLPTLLPPTATHATTVHILTYPTPIRVSYKEVRALIPSLLASYAPNVDLVLHIGMASGRKHYSLERLAHRDGYSRSPDVDGERLAPDAGSRDFGDCKHLLTTTLDYDEVFAGWEGNLRAEGVEGVTVEESNDPGHYLCDYIYFNSLAWFARRNQQGSDGRVEDRPVLFLHVPAESDGESLQKGTTATTALLRAMAESWSVSKRYERTIA